MKVHLTALPLLLFAAVPAYGQDSDYFRVRVGLGGQVRPDFIGSKDYELAPLWDVDFASGTNQFRFEAPDDVFGIPAISSGSFAAGPALNVASGRKDSDVGAPVGKVSTTFEAGGFMQYDLSKSVRIRADLRKGIGGHNGVVGAVGADYIWRDGDRYVFSVGPRLLFSNERYQQAYFGVSPAAALATGPPLYRPGGGIHAVALASGLSYQFNPRFGMFGFARYERLVGDAAKSPIVRQFGSRDQFSAGLGLSYTFILKR
jgi:outer membrane protein